MRENREIQRSPVPVRGGGTLGEGQGRKPEMHDRRKSDRSVLPAKPPNNTADAVAEVVEGRDLAKGNTTSKTRPGHRAGLSALSALDRVRQSQKGIRTRGSLRFCTTSTSIACERRIGR